MRHTSTPPRDRFIRVRRAVIRSDRCMRCPYPLDHHTTVHLRGEVETHCPYCSCADCPDPDDFTNTTPTRRHP